MSKTKILTYVFGVVAVGLAYYLYYTINSSIQETKRIERIEARIINRLMQIRDAEIGYKAVNGSYTSDWDKLLNFIDSGTFYLTEKTEFVKTLAYGADSTWVEVDTIGSISVRDSLFHPSRVPNFDLETFAYVPGVDPPVKFLIWTDKITKAGLLVDAIEVWNPSPVNPLRDEESEYNTKKPLRFGSRVSITTAGNWE